MYSDDETRLRHMLDGAREAIAIAGRRARDDPQADRVLALALVKLIEIVGEAAAKVTRQFQEAHPEIPWRQIVGMRHVLVHDYDRIDFDVVWSVVTTDLPALVAVLEPIVPPWQEPD
jgi:uncharacterized protein with HEPN domain